MRVLIACEFSGVVREAFRRKGHDAWSCDLLPTEIPGQHIQGDVREVLNDGWDLMIAHPPCTYLVNRAQYWAKRRNNFTEVEKAINFFLSLWNAKINKIAIENPVGIMSTRFRKPDQYIEPFQHGHSERKRTGLWLKNLTPLKPSNLVDKPEPKYICKDGRKLYYTDSLKGNHGGHERSKTFPGIAEAMANQWGNIETLPIQLEWDQLNGK